MTYIADDKEFNIFIMDKVLVEFSSKECHACFLAEPFLVELERAYPFKIGIADITLVIKMIGKYNIQAVPTFIMFEEQKELFRMNGFRNKFELEKQLRRYR